MSDGERGDNGSLSISGPAGFTPVELLVGVAVHVFDWAVRLQRLEQQRETFRFDSLWNKVRSGQNRRLVEPR